MRLVLIFTLLTQSFTEVNAQELLLTGTIISSKVQQVTAPKSTSWKLQVQWLFEEGELIKQDELLAVFDSGNMLSQLEQTNEKLNTANMELSKKNIEAKISLQETSAKLEIAIKNVEKSSIENDITADKISRYDKRQYKLNLERSWLEKIKTEQNKNFNIKEQKIIIEKQEIEVMKLKQAIEYQQHQLSRMSVKAEFSGQVSYAMHPWNRQKITAGTSVRTGMNILQVQGSEDFMVEAWIHEIDALKLSLTSPLIVSLDAFPNKNFVCIIKSISSQPEKRAQWGVSAYYRVIIEFENAPKLKLLPGMSARVVI